MAVATSATIKTQLLLGTYPDNTLSTDNIFDYKQYEKRRKYPSCEIETVQPESTNETLKSTELTVGYEISYYVRNLGARTDEVANQKLVEDVIISQMESFVLQDHKITFENKSWNRKQVNKAPGHPAYTISTLKITVRQITTTTAPADGTLTFIVSGSSVDTPPSSNYAYTNVFDVDLQSGYATIEEGVTGTHITKKFAGHLQGHFIANVMVKSADLGSTGDKLDQMPKLNSNGEKPTYKFTYVDLTSDSSTITNTFTCELTSMNVIYSTSQGVVFKIIAKLISDVSVIVS